MAFRPNRGRWTNKYYATKASTAYALGEVVYTDGTNVLPAVATTEDILGIVDEVKASSDTSTDRIKILVPSDSSCTALALVGTGTPTAAFEGRLCDLDNSAPTLSLDVSTSTESCCRIERFHSATEVEVSFSATKR